MPLVSAIGGFTLAFAAREQPSNPRADVVEVIRKRDFSLDGRANSTQRIVLAEGISCEDWSSVTMVTRLHDKNLWRTGAGLPTAAILRTEAKCIYLDEDDPDVEYADVRTVQSSSITDATAVPFLDVTQVSFEVGSMLRIGIIFGQGAFEAGSAQTFSLSVELVGRRVYV